MTCVVQESTGVRFDLAHYRDIIRAGGQPDAADAFLAAYFELTERLRSGMVQYRPIDPELFGIEGLYAGKLGSRFSAWNVIYTLDHSTIKIQAVVGTAMSEASITRLITFRLENAKL